MTVLGSRLYGLNLHGQNDWLFPGMVDTLQWFYGELSNRAGVAHG